MTLAEFNQSVPIHARPPDGLSLALQALWWEAKGNWDAAHTLAQNDPGPIHAWVHAYLHRVEGDEANAAYWYARALKPVAHGPLRPEREHIVASLLGDR